MATRSSTMGGSRSSRMSSMVAGDKPRSKSVVSTASGTTNVTAGAPVTNLGANIKDKKAITDRVPAYVEKPGITTKSPRARTVADAYGVAKAPTKYTPGSYAAYRKALAAKKPVVAAVVKPTIKPTAKKPPKIAAPMLRSALGLAPTKSARVSTKPPATRFGVVTGKTTGTRVSGGGGYGGGGTRGGGSLSGQGSGSRSAGTSRTGGTQRNDPVRG